MMKLKKKLLATDYFIDNLWLDKYCELIENNKNTIKQSDITQKHHILQKAYYKIVNKRLDNSKNNIVNLKYSDHILAHYYLCYCTKDELMKKNYQAFYCMISMAPKNFNLEDFYRKNYIDYNEEYKKYVNICKQRYLGKNNPMYGRHHTEETKKKLHDYFYGKKMSSEFKKKQSELNSGKNNPMYGKNRTGINAGNKRSVRCIETGQIFPTCTDAAKWCKRDVGAVSKVCKGIHKTTGGYHWEYVEQ